MSNEIIKNTTEQITTTQQSTQKTVVSRNARDSNVADNTYKKIDSASNASTNKLTDFLRENNFFYVGKENSPKDILWDKSTNLLWAVIERKVDITMSDVHKLVDGCVAGSIGNWKLPSRAELIDFAQNIENPFAKYANGFSGDKSGDYALYGSSFWHIRDGVIELKGASPKIFNQLCQGYVIACNHCFQNKSVSEIFEIFLENHWQLQSTKNKKILSHLSLLVEETINADKLRANLHPIPLNDFLDPQKGVWELFGLPDEELRNSGFYSRDPAKDIQQGVIAIDFGTTSTVVAYDTKHGKRELLRVGLSNLNVKAKPEHYENPTILEFVNYDKMLSAWRKKSRCPDVAWGDMHYANAAKQALRDKVLDTNSNSIFSRIFTYLKQWVKNENTVWKGRDATGKEFEIVSNEILNPTNGEEINVNEDYPFDPIELYAWFLGTNINWRKNGIFLNYYLSFPVAYQSQEKERILAAFRRGLFRSLPRTLDLETIWKDFNVEERADEASAYIAGALPKLDIPLTEKGEKYAVFDFGGGTLDFNFGLVRLPTEEEYEEEYAKVIENYKGGGDPFLGGENLIMHLSYATFCLEKNLEICRKNNISFMKPEDADEPAGTEILIDDSRAAYTNTLILSNILRSLFEKGQILDSLGNDLATTGILPPCRLINREGVPVHCDGLQINEPELRKLLHDKILKGVKSFLVAMRDAFGIPDADAAQAVGNAQSRALKSSSKIHILLAGNASRSHIVSDFFGLVGVSNKVTNKTNSESNELQTNKLSPELDETLHNLFGDKVPNFKVHAPLDIDKADIYAPTAKTSVALGLLELQPGSATLCISHSIKNTDGEAPFDHYIGKKDIRKGLFDVRINRGDDYNRWIQVSAIREGITILYHTTSALALTKEMEIGDTNLTQLRIKFDGNTQGCKAFVRAVKPHEIEVCAAHDEAEANSISDNQIQRFTLTE